MEHHSSLIRSGAATCIILVTWLDEVETTLSDNSRTDIPPHTDIPTADTRGHVNVVVQSYARMMTSKKQQVFLSTQPTDHLRIEIDGN